ncbi:UNVERIFIED_CONTAM: Vacuolar protein sorting-associated protein 35A [Sesamum radiatum]|uniref:Vacuolar protein sorting-associated protein 35 n=1 Tax=Sesamum radiatum TaxID=300843 RepID=A0AAW2P5D5_SESRA
MIADGVEDEEKWLSAGIAGLQQNAFYMHRALDSNNLKDALKYSAQMLSELRTSRLSPHKYYELYMRAFDELRKLELFFKEETSRGCSIVELYELVQHAGNILPRLYLLCTVGSVYIKSKEAPANDVLKDLVEMCRGIQHPLRGLFLRSYLSQVSRDKLPDIGSEYEGDADTVMDSVEFVLQNFTEMNKLWVRMQHQGPAREKEKREKERSELRDLVGKNLHVLSQIEGVDLEMYKEIVLPRVLEQTLETLLNACPQLQPSVDLKTVLARLMERLSNYAASGAEVLPEFFQVEAFAKLNNAIGKVIEAQENMPIAGVVTLFASLLTFTLQVHPDRLDYIDQILEMANVIIQNIMKNKTRITTAEKVDALFELIKGLIRDLDEDLHDELDEEDFKEEQNSVARLIQMLHSDDPEEMSKIIHTVRKHILTGGRTRLPFTVPPLIFSSLKLVRRLEGQDESVSGNEASTTPKKIFQIVTQIIESLSSIPVPELALGLYLQCAEDSKAQVTCIHLIIGTLQRMHVFGVENRDALTHKATGYSAKLLKKPDQCRAVYACSHLFWLDEHDRIRDGGGALITILDLIELIRSEMNGDNAPSDPAADAFLASTLRYIQFQKDKGGAVGERYELIKV